MTPKQRAFALHKLAGLSNRMAVISAGYSSAGAKQMGTRLMKHPAVLELLGPGYGACHDNKSLPTYRFRHDAGVWDAVDDAMPKQSYTCPIEFLTHAMNCRSLSIAARAEFAAALMPYHHAKV